MKKFKGLIELVKPRKSEKLGKRGIAACHHEQRGTKSINAFKANSNSNVVYRYRSDNS